MLQVARNKLTGVNTAYARVEFVHADALDWEAPAGEFDLIATHFFWIASLRIASPRWLLALVTWHPQTPTGCWRIFKSPRPGGQA